MKVALTNMTNFPSRQVKCFDLHEEFGLAYFVEQGDTVTLYFNDRACRLWLKGGYPFLEHVRWLESDEVIAWWREGWEAVVISDTAWKKLGIGSPYRLLLSKRYIFVGYWEQGVRSQSDLLYLHHVVCAFSREGAFELGLEDLMTANNFRDSSIEIQAGYAFEDRLTFITCCVQDCIWILDVPKKTLRRIPVPFSTVALHLVTGDAKRAYGIYDNRPLLYYHPDWPAFECATFDFETEKSSKCGFAPVEAVLTAAGFEMAEIKFQPNATGRIIVSDSKKAALLEFCE
jgi:hypothetical protein